MKKIKAIIECYGEKSLKKCKEIKLSTGELITSWKIENMTKKELLRTFKNQEIVWIYESGV